MQCHLVVAPKLLHAPKHIDVKVHHVRSLVAEGVVDVTHIKTQLQRADILTKPLGAVKFLKNRLPVQWSPL